MREEGGTMRRWLRRLGILLLILVQLLQMLGDRLVAHYSRR